MNSADPCDESCQLARKAALDEEERAEEERQLAKQKRYLEQQRLEEEAHEEAVRKQRGPPQPCAACDRFSRRLLDGSAGMSRCCAIADLIEKSGIELVVWDMDQTAIKTHTEGHVPGERSHGAATKPARGEDRAVAAYMVKNVSPDFVCLATALQCRGIKQAVATYSDPEGYESAQSPLDLAGVELAATLVDAVLPDPDGSTTKPHWIWSIVAKNTRDGKLYHLARLLGYYPGGDFFLTQQRALRKSIEAGRGALPAKTLQDLRAALAGAERDDFYQGPDTWNPLREELGKVPLDKVLLIDDDPANVKVWTALGAHGWTVQRRAGFVLPSADEMRRVLPTPPEPASPGPVSPIESPSA